MPSTRNCAEVVALRKTKTVEQQARVTEDIPGYDPYGPLLEVDGLSVEFRTQDGVAQAVDNVSWSVSPGETLGLIGESGCGKSVTAQAVMGILDSPPGFVTDGEVRLRGVDLLKLDKDVRREVRANDVAIIFQDALSALNPVFSIGFQLGELYRKHRGATRAEGKKRAVELLELVGIPDARNRVKGYPHQFSGGQRQRVMIAMALALDPEVLIADEPTTALDVTIQAQILDLLGDIQRERNMGLVMITHDMGVVADMCDDIAVMYAGRIVERAGVKELYSRPAHPYTHSLLNSIPRVDLKGQELAAIEGLPPNLMHIPPGCSFHPRCPLARDRCRQDEPPLYDIGLGRASACHYWNEVMEK